MKTIRWLSLLAAGSAFYLLVAGAQVNAYRAALAVPDWPLSYGRLLAPEWPGNVFYEQHHRATAGATVMLFAGVLGAAMRRKDLAALRRVSRYAAAALALQVLLGGLIVLRLNPPWLGAIHVVVAVATVVLIASTALLAWRPSGPSPGSPTLDKTRGRAKIALSLVALQLILGSITRHPPAGDIVYIGGLMAHLLNGVFATVFLVLVGVSMARLPRTDGIRGWAWLLLSAVLAQFVIGAWLFVIAPEPFDDSWPPPVPFPALHASHLVLAAFVATCLVAALLRVGPRESRALQFEP